MEATQFVERVHERATELAPENLEVSRLSHTDPDVVELVSSVTKDNLSSRVDEVAKQIVHVAMRDQRLGWMVQTQCHGQWRPMQHPELSKSLHDPPENEHRIPLSSSHHTEALKKLRQQQERMRNRA